MEKQIKLQHTLKEMPGTIQYLHNTNKSRIDNTE